ncbi:hypothetical protein NB717_002931 [Xanthomonas sacchari]|nr:hypothetical protein [Xanthomonas sacchari]
MVRQRDLARARMSAAADQRHRAGGVVRCAVGALPPACRIHAAAADRSDGRALQCLGFAGRGQDPGQARGQQGLAAAGAADQQQVVMPGRGDLQDAPRLRLAAHVAQVGKGRGDRGRRGGRGQGLAAVEQAADFQQGACGVGLHVLRQRGLGAVVGRDDQGAPSLGGGQCGRQHAVDRTQFAGQGQFAEEFVLAEHLRVKLAGGGEDAQRDRQVEAAALLGQVGRGQVDRDPPCRELVLRAEQGGADAVARFAYRRLGQADDLRGRQAAGQMDFDPNRRRKHPRAGTAVHQRQAHGGGWIRRWGWATARCVPLPARRRCAPALRASRACAAAPRAALRIPRG